MWGVIFLGLAAVGFVFATSYFFTSRKNTDNTLKDFYAPTPKGTIVELIGIKKPDSKNEWDGQLVAYRFDTGYVGAAVFENHMDYVSSRSNPPKWETIIKDIEKMKSEGWIDMTPEEIKKCAGIEMGTEYK